MSTVGMIRAPLWVFALGSASAAGLELASLLPFEVGWSLAFVWTVVVDATFERRERALQARLHKAPAAELQRYAQQMEMARTIEGRLTSAAGRVGGVLVILLAVGAAAHHGAFRSETTSAETGRDSTSDL